MWSTGSAASTPPAGSPTARSPACWVWRSGDRLTLTVGAGMVVARRDPGGMVAVPTRPYIVIPAALRHRCGLRAGDRVLLAALPGEDALTAYSFAVVDQAIRAHAALPVGERSRS